MRFGCIKMQRQKTGLCGLKGYVVTDILYYVKIDCAHACNLFIPINAHIPHGVRSVSILNSWLAYN